MGAKATADPAEALKASTKSEVDAVMKDYTTNKARTVQYVVSKVLEVSVGLTDTQKQALSAGVV